MAWEMPGADEISVPAHDNLSAKQFYFVTLNSDFEAIAITADTQYPVGILQNNPAAGENAVIMLRGVSKFITDEAVTPTQLVGPSADGQGAVRTLAVGSNLKYVSGMALDTTTQAGQTGTLLLRDPFAVQIAA